MGKNLREHLDILLRELGVVEAQDLSAGQGQLVHAAAAQGQYGVQLVHHIDVVQAVETIPAPAHVFKAAGHVFLPVEVVGPVAGRAEGLLGVVHHLCNLFLGGQTLPLFKQIGALFQRQGVHGDVAGIQGGDRVQGAAEARKAVCGETRDEVHVDGVKAKPGGLLKGAEHVGCRVGTPAGPENGVNHALGVDADPVGTVRADGGKLFRVLDVFEKACSLNQKGAQMLGLHLEGPFFSAQRSGAQDPSYLKNPVPENYMKFLEASDKIMRWSVAPELEGAMDFADELSRRGILPSIAHSDAVYEVAEEAYRHGCSHVTHLYCAMSSIVRKNAFRYAGIQEAAYLIDDMTVEIIADGVHLPKPLLQYAYKFKGPDKTALCTDAIRGAGMPDGQCCMLGSKEKGQLVLIEDGVAKLPDRSAFAGSVATTDRLVRTMVNLADVPLEHAVKMMTLTPSRIMHIDDRKGSIKAGKDADFVIFDDNVKVEYTIVASKVIYKANN